MESIPYKQYTRTPRSQAVTNNFSGGMCYTNQPIQEGYCRLLVNYDVTDSGSSISSRPGLFVTNHQIVKEYATNSEEFKAFDLTASKFLTEAQVKSLDSRYEPVYIFLKDAMVINDREGLGTICTIMQDLSGAQVLREQAQARCINPAPKTVFDFPFQNSRELLQPLYCTAWNDSFYTFLKDKTDNSVKLAYLEKNKTTIINPKVPTDSEVEKQGYNALQTNMYNTVFPKNPIVLSSTRNKKKNPSGINISTPDAYSIGVIEASTLTAVDSSKLKPNTLYYIVMNYNLPSYVIDEDKWDADKYEVQERITTFKLTELTTDTTVDVNMSAYSEDLTFPIAEALQVFYENSKGTARPNRHYDNIQKYSFETNSYKFVSGRGKYNSDDTGFYGYRDGMANSLAPKLLYFPFITGSGATAHTFRIIHNETWSVGSSYSGSYESCKDIEIVVAAKEDLETDFTKRYTYTLSLGKTFAFWKNCLWIGNVPENPTGLFYSQTDWPEYFPYPSNSHFFTEPIIKLITMKDSLLVFTKSKLYSLNYTDELQLTIKCIQQNLYITEADAHLILTVKNMVFFKSGNYYYMVVPKANSLTNELTIAPVSKNITGFLDNFKSNIYTVLNKTYNITKEAFQELRLINYYNFLDYEDIINVFKFTTAPQEYEEESEKEYQDYYVLLLYNSVSRYWRLYTLCYPHKDNVTNRIQAVTNNATQRAEYILLKKVLGTKQFIDLNKKDLKTITGTRADSIQLVDLDPRNKLIKVTNGTEGANIDVSTDTELLDQTFDKEKVWQTKCTLSLKEALPFTFSCFAVVKIKLSTQLPEDTYYTLDVVDTTANDAYQRLLDPTAVQTLLTDSELIISGFRRIYSASTFTATSIKISFNKPVDFQVEHASIRALEKYLLQPDESVYLKYNNCTVFGAIPHSSTAKITVTYDNFATETVPEEQGFIALETLKWDKAQVTDYYTDKVQTVYSADLSYIDEQNNIETNNPKFHSLKISDIETSPIYTYLDTGYLTVAPTLKKRFREYQFGLARQVLEQNVDEVPETIAFDFTFYMDSEQRQHRIAFSPYLKVDSSGNFKQLMIKHFTEQTVHPEYALPVGTASSIAMPRECDTDIMLETDMNYKIRIPISGKGYLPRFTLRTTHQKPYTIYNQALVYRTLNAR